MRSSSAALDMNVLGHGGAVEGQGQMSLGMGMGISNSMGSPSDETPKLTPGMLTHDVEVEGRRQRRESGVRGRRKSSVEGHGRKERAGAGFLIGGDGQRERERD